MLVPRHRAGRTSPATPSPGAARSRSPRRWPPGTGGDVAAGGPLHPAHGRASARRYAGQVWRGDGDGAGTRSTASPWRPARSSTSSVRRRVRRPWASRTSASPASARTSRATTRPTAWCGSRPTARRWARIGATDARIDEAYLAVPRRPQRRAGRRHRRRWSGACRPSRWPRPAGRAPGRSSRGRPDRRRVHRRRAVVRAGGGRRPDRDLVSPTARPSCRRAARHRRPRHPAAHATCASAPTTPRWPWASAAPPESTTPAVRRAVDRPRAWSAAPARRLVRRPRQPAVPTAARPGTTASWSSAPTTAAATPTPASGPRRTAWSGPRSSRAASAAAATSGPARWPRSPRRRRRRLAGGRDRHRRAATATSPCGGVRPTARSPAATEGERALGGAGRPDGHQRHRRRGRPRHAGRQRLRPGRPVGVRPARPLTGGPRRPERAGRGYQPRSASLHLEAGRSRRPASPSPRPRLTLARMPGSS